MKGVGLAPVEVSTCGHRTGLIQMAAGEDGCAVSWSDRFVRLFLNSGTWFRVPETVTVVTIVTVTIVTIVT